MLCFLKLHLRFVLYISNTQYMLEMFETILVRLFTFNINSFDVPVVYVLQLFIGSEIGNRKIAFVPFVGF